MRIVLSGGGTGGSVTPLLAIAKEIKRLHKGAEFLWLGTFWGPERRLVQREDIHFISIFSGKLRRYFSWRNFVDPVFVIVGLFQSLYILKKFRPSVMVSTGGFVSVPVAYAARLVGAKIYLHQLDVKPGLASRIIAHAAHKISVTFPESVNDFPASKTLHTGTPVRDEIFEGDKIRAQESFGLDSDMPTLLILGGGTGALSLNKIVISALPELLNFVQVLHITGSGKGLPPVALKEKEGRYHAFEFVVDELPNMYAAADVVISRAGLGTILELSALGKPTILVPIPDSHQEKNAAYLKERQAAFVLDQKNLSAQKLIEEIRELITDQQALSYLGRRINTLYAQYAKQYLSGEILNLALKDR